MQSHLLTTPVPMVCRKLVEFFSVFFELDRFIGLIASKVGTAE